MSGIRVASVMLVVCKATVGEGVGVETRKVSRSPTLGQIPNLTIQPGKAHIAMGCVFRHVVAINGHASDSQLFVELVRTVRLLDHINYRSDLVDSLWEKIEVYYEQSHLAPYTEGSGVHVLQSLHIWDPPRPNASSKDFINDHILHAIVLEPLP